MGQVQIHIGQINYVQSQIWGIIKVKQSTNSSGLKDTDIRNSNLDNTPKLFFLQKTKALSYMITANQTDVCKYRKNMSITLFQEKSRI